MTFTLYALLEHVKKFADLTQRQSKREYNMKAADACDLYPAVIR